MDAVFTWVDGNDPVLKAKRQSYVTDRREDTLEDIAGRERYIQSDEILFAIGSILRFAPYIDRIFIVTDGQKPDLDGFLSRNFPDSKVGITIVDHRVIFGGGYEQYLPVFNSLAIESVIHRIPGLSEEFLYFNDDVFLTSPTEKEDFFQDGKVVCHTEKMSALGCRILRAIRRKKNGHKRLTFKDTMLNSAQLLGLSYFFYIQHKPHPFLKSVMEDFYQAHPEALLSNISHRFRDPEQFNVQGLFYLLADAEGLLIKESPAGRTLMIRKTAGKNGYLDRKLREADKSERLLFGCVNSLQDMDSEEKTKVLDWLCRRIGVSL